MSDRGRPERFAVRRNRRGSQDAVETRSESKQAFAFERTLLPTKRFFAGLAGAARSLHHVSTRETGGIMAKLARE